MKALKKIILEVICVVLLPAMGYSGSGDTAGIILNKPVTANQAALGGAVAAERDLNALRINPAGLTGIEGREISLMYNRGYFEDNFISAVYVQQAGFVNIGVNVVYSATDKIGVWTTNNGYVEEIGQQDVIVSLSASSDKLINSFPVGINVTMLNSSVFGNTASAFSAGAGIQKAVEVAGNEMRLGAGIQNIGTKLTYLQYDSPLPAFVQAGVSYSINLAGRKMGINSDLRLPLNHDDSYLMGGIKYEAIENVSLLVGGEINLDSGISYSKLSFGGNIKSGVYKFSYVMNIVQNIDLAHYVSMGVKL